MAHKTSKKKSLFSLFLALLVALLAVLFGWEPVSELILTPPEGSSFLIRFLDVGQADAAYIECDGERMLIDGGNAEDSDLIYSFLEQQRVSHLDYIICSHAHEDHVGGLAGALVNTSVDTAFAPVTSYDSRAFESFVKYLASQEVSITVPTPGDSFSLGSAQVTVLGPIFETENTNNTSIVLRIVYGETSFLFTGDAEIGAEEDLLLSGCALRSTVLKVGHHGSDTSSSRDFLNRVSPQYAVISVGKNNSYDHPSQEVLSRLKKLGCTIYRTDTSGDIFCSSDGVNVYFQTEK